MKENNHNIERIEPNEWVLYLHHEYHDADESQYVLLPDTLSYDDIYIEQLPIYNIIMANV